MLASILSIVFSGFLIGSLARWAIPGPDPMPAWLTIGIGISGSLFGGVPAALIVGTSDRGDVFTILIASILVAALLVIAYRRFVQRRPVTGPEAHRLPTRGFGIARFRERLKRFGIDPDSVGGRGARSQASAAKAWQAHPTVDHDADRHLEDNLRRLGELRDEGILTDEEYVVKKAQLERGESQSP